MLLQTLGLSSHLPDRSAQTILSTSGEGAVLGAHVAKHVKVGVKSSSLR